MPYIKDKFDRRFFDDLIKAHHKMFTRKGCLNYFLFKLAKETCKNYDDYRKLLGELECAKLEIYRRQIANYEDKKIKENGDI